MARANRDWKTFDRRWASASRFELFLFWSVLVHMVFGVLVTMPVQSAQQEKKAIEERFEKQEAEKKKEEEKAVARAQEEVLKVLKEELAEAELKPLFLELAADFLQGPELQAYWQDLEMELGPELEMLADMLAHPETFAPLEVEQKLQNLKEMVVPKLADLVERKQLQPLREEAMANAEALAKDLAKFFKEGLKEKVGQPLGANLQKLIQGEEMEAQAALRRADNELAKLGEMAQALAKEMGRAQDRFDDLGKKLDAAEKAPKKDARLLGEIRKELQGQRMELSGTGKQLKDVQTRLKVAEKDLGQHLPGAMQLLQQANQKATEGLGKHLQNAVAQAAASKPGEAAKEAGEGKKALEETRATLAKLQTAVQLQLAAQGVDRLERDVAQQAGKAEAQAKKSASKDGKELARLTEEMAAAATKARGSEEEAKKLGQQLATNKSALDKILDKKDGKDTKSSDLKAGADKTEAALAQARGALENKAPDKAGEKFKEAGNELAKLREEITRAQAKLGVKGENSAEMLAKNLNDLREQLGKDADKNFQDAMKDKGLPGLTKKVLGNLDNQLKGAKGVTKKFRDDLAKQVEGALAKELAKLPAGKEVAKAAGEKMTTPLPHLAGAKSESPRVGEQTAKAATTAKTTLTKDIAGLVDAGVKGAPTTKLLDPKTVASAGKEGELAKRLENFQNQLDAKRTDFLGQPNGAGLAALQRRNQARQASVGRSGGLLTDPKVYAQMLEAIKGRGQILGEDWARTGVVGEQSKGEEETGLRPALLLSPEPTKEVEKVEGKREVQAPTFKTHRFTGIPYLADDAIKIDGDLADWKDMPTFLLDPVIRTGTNLPIKNKPATQTAHVAYTSRGLIIAVDVVDTSGELENKQSANGQFWLNDCVEIYLDTLNTKYATRGEPNTHQFFAFPFGSQDDDMNGGFESHFIKVGDNIDWKKIAYSKEQMPRAAKKTEHGWAMEILIPKTALRRGEIKPGRIIGFNLQIDTGTSLYYFWTAAKQVQVSMHPNLWGDIQFLGSDAKIELVGPDGKEPRQAVQPGQPIHVRVADADMNLDEQKKDKISVTLRSASGATQSLVLEETTVNSGVFTGAVSSRLSIGGSQPGILEVFEGETVTIEYIDQARSYGERNVPLRRGFPVGALGTKLGDN